MIVGSIYALLASIINLTILGNLLGSGIPIQLAVVGATLGWLYQQPRFAWTVMIVSGILYDTLATTRYGLYIILFVILGMVIEQLIHHRTRFGTNPTLFITSAVAGIAIFATTLVGSGLTTVTIIVALAAAAVLTGSTTVLFGWILRRYEHHD